MAERAGVFILKGGDSLLPLEPKQFAKRTTSSVYLHVFQSYSSGIRLIQKAHAVGFLSVGNSRLRPASSEHRSGQSIICSLIRTAFQRSSKSSDKATVKLDVK